MEITNYYDLLHSVTIVPDGALPESVEVELQDGTRGHLSAFVVGGQRFARPLNAPTKTKT